MFQDWDTRIHTPYLKGKYVCAKNVKPTCQCQAYKRPQEHKVKEKEKKKVPCLTTVITKGTCIHRILITVRGCGGMEK